MKKFCVLFSLLMSTMVFTACGAGIKYSSDSNSSNSIVTIMILENLKKAKVEKSQGFS